MKLPAGLLLLCLAMMLSVRAEETAPVKKEVPAVKRELVWPEIKDPQALIDFAKAEIAKAKNKGIKLDQIQLTADSPLAYLHPLWNEAIVTENLLYIDFDTHPQIGQGLILMPNPKDDENNLLPFLVSDRDRDIRAKITNKKIPEIKYVLRKNSFGSGDISWWGKSVVRWKNIQIVDQTKNTSPFPLAMQLPEYPANMLRYGVAGEAKIEFTVSEQGIVTALKITTPRAGFETAVRDATRKWRFDPRVDIETRLPAATEISLTIQFNVEDCNRNRGVKPLLQLGQIRIPACRRGLSSVPSGASSSSGCRLSSSSSVSASARTAS